jgi:hypothetical protein
VRTKCDVANGMGDESLEKTGTWSNFGLEEGFLPQVFVAVCSVSVVLSYSCDDQGLDGR